MASGVLTLTCTRPGGSLNTSTMSVPPQMNRSYFICPVLSVPLFRCHSRALSPAVHVLPTLHHLPSTPAMPETGRRLDPLAVGQVDPEHVRLARRRHDGAGGGRRRGAPDE